MILPRTGTPGVYVPCDDPAIIDDSVMTRLVEEATKNTSGTARILLHRDPAERLHEMLIVHRSGFYIRPHINSNSAKSYILLDGEMIVGWFSNTGELSGRCRLAMTGSPANKVLRFDSPVFHTLIPVTPTVTFVETILGPHSETAYAEWAPSRASVDAPVFHDELKRTLLLDG